MKLRPHGMDRRRKADDDALRTFPTHPPVVPGPPKTEPGTSSRKRRHRAPPHPVMTGWPIAPPHPVMTGWPIAPPHFPSWPGTLEQPDAPPSPSRGRVAPQARGGVNKRHRDGSRFLLLGVPGSCCASPGTTNVCLPGAPRSRLPTVVVPSLPQSHPCRSGAAAGGTRNLDQKEAPPPRLTPVMAGWPTAPPHFPSWPGSTRPSTP